MIRIKFINNSNSVSFLLERNKIAILRNVNDYWAVRKAIENNISKVQKSDYSEEFNNNTDILIDEDLIDKSTELLLVDDHFSIDEEIKLGSKSLLLRYLSKIASENEITDEYLQLETMFSLVTDIISDEFIEFEPQTLTYKLLAKIIDVSFLKNELKCNSLDLSYEDNIIYQLKLINKIVSLEKHYIVIVDIIRLTSKIYEYISKINNCRIVIICQFCDLDDLQNNIFIEGIDFEDDDSIYEGMENMTDIYNLDEYKEKLKNQRLKSLK